MKSIQTNLMLFASVACLAGHVSAEFRPWTDTKGNVIEAEYVRMAEQTVVLRTRDDMEIRVPLESLCEEDGLHAMLLSPPELEIGVDDKMDRETLGYTGGRVNPGKVEMQSVKVEVSIRKTSSGQYNPELLLEIFLIGQMEQLDRYVILERSSSEFRFTDENKGRYSYTCGPVDLRNVSGKRRAGVEYEGYLLVVRDALDEIIATKANRLEFEKHAEAILKARKGGIFDEDFDFIRAATQPRIRPGGRGERP